MLYVDRREVAQKHVFNPHQRCGYSDSPFARIHYFYTAGSRDGLEGVGGGGPTYKIIKNIGFSPSGAGHPKVQNPKIGLPITPRPF